MPACDVCKGSFTVDQLVPIGGKNVCARCKPELVMNLKSGVGATPRIDPRKAREIKSKIARLNLLSFVLALPGMAIEVFAGRWSGGSGMTGGSAQAGMLAFQGLGAALVIGGLVCYALMKGRSGALGLLGLLSCLGLLILHFLSKNCHHCGGDRFAQCQGMLDLRRAGLTVK
jgi:hypothetical protein